MKNCGLPTNYQLTITYTCDKCFKSTLLKKKLFYIQILFNNSVERCPETDQGRNVIQVDLME